jgi:hypothetical protein
MSQNTAGYVLCVLFALWLTPAIYMLVDVLLDDWNRTQRELQDE